MKSIILSLSIVLLTLMILPNNASAQAAGAQRIGFVNSAKVLQEFPEAQEANRRLEATGRQWQGELERMSKELQQKYDDFQKKEPLLKEEEKRSQREELIQLEQKGIAFRQQKFGSDGDLAIMTDSLMGPIKQKVIRVIERVAKEEKLQFIFDRNDQIYVLLYGDPKFDYTNLVIDRLKRTGDGK